jgi:hypothetical protein
MELVSLVKALYCYEQYKALKALEYDFYTYKDRFYNQCARMLKNTNLNKEFNKCLTKYFGYLSPLISDYIIWKVYETNGSVYSFLQFVEQICNGYTR